MRRFIAAVAVVTCGFVFGGTAEAGTVTQTFGFTGGVQSVTIPAGVHSVTIQASGAQGGNSSFGGGGGAGALVAGTFTTGPGDVWSFIVGGMGGSGTNGGGGGGSFVFKGFPGNLWLAAGGGGGGACHSANGFVAGGVPGSAGQAGTPSVLGTPGGSPQSGGAGGASGFHGGGGGGGGLFGSGGNGAPGFTGSGIGGQAINFGAMGGASSPSFPGTQGGYGGGGGAAGAAGGGGGYGGGGGGNASASCDAGGGGGSFNRDPVGLNVGGAWFGNGRVIFTWTVADTDLALTNTPSDITTPATSSDGAAVTYTPPTVVDEDSPLPTVTCDHPSGSTFPVGTTTVTCTVTDPDDTPNTVSTSFNVTVTDTDLALANTPADITVNATSPAGANVGYTPPTAVDEDSPLPTVTCDHPSGSTFAIGTTTVTCTVTDPDDTPNTVSTSFNVTVVGAAGQLQQLAAAVTGVGPGGSLAGKIQQAQAYLAAGDVADAKAVLNAFINEVKAQSGKKIGSAQAAQLIAAAQQILAVLG